MLHSSPANVYIRYADNEHKYIQKVKSTHFFYFFLFNHTAATKAARKTSTVRLPKSRFVLISLSLFIYFSVKHNCNTTLEYQDQPPQFLKVVEKKLDALKQYDKSKSEK